MGTDLKMPDDELTIEEGAARAGWSASTMWRHIRAGRLSTRRMLGRVLVRAEDVDRLRDQPRRAVRQKQSSVLKRERVAKVAECSEAEIEGANLRIVEVHQTQTRFYLRGVIIESGEEFVLDLRAND